MLGKIALGLIVAGVVGAAVLYSMVRGYLHSEGFRRFLSEEVSKAAEVDGSFTLFRWDGLAVDTSAFEATGEGIVKELRLDGLHTEVGVSGVRRGVWELRGSQMQRLEVSLDATDLAGKSLFRSKRQGAPARKKVNGWLPTEVEVQGLDVREVVVKAILDQGPVSVSGVKARVEPAGKKDAYHAELANGTIRLPFALVPEIRLGRARLRYQDGQVFLNSATAKAWKDGRLGASGEWDSAAGRYSIEGDISGVKCEDLFNEDWSKRCIGDLSTDFSLDNHSGAVVARGRLALRDATLTALPILDALAAYADTRRFRILSLNEAHTDWKWKNGEIFLSNLVLASEGLVRLEGNIFIRGRELDGTFRLGLAAGTLASIPGAETDVFVPGERSLVWAPLRITGTLDDPKEDLTDRLIAAAGLRMFDVIPETGVRVIKFSRSLLGDSPAGAVDQGVKIIEEGGKKVIGFGGLLDGLLGGGTPPVPQPEPQPEPNPTPVPEGKKQAP